MNHSLWSQSRRVDNGHTGKHQEEILLTDKVWFGGNSTTRHKRKTEAAKHPQSKDTKTIVLLIYDE